MADHSDTKLHEAKVCLQQYRDEHNISKAKHCIYQEKFVSRIHMLGSILNCHKKECCIKLDLLASNVA